MDDELQPYLRGRVEEAWPRCLEVWRRRGRVEDFPKGIRLPKYMPDLGKRLGQAFASRFAYDVEFVAGKLSAQDAVEALCAYEILEFICCEWLHRRRDSKQILEKELKSLKAPLPAPVLAEVRSDSIYERFKGKSIGDFFAFIDKIGEY